MGVSWHLDADGLASWMKVGQISDAARFRRKQFSVGEQNFIMFTYGGEFWGVFHMMYC